MIVQVELGARRDLPQYRDPAIILLDQLKEVYFDGELEVVETSNYFPKIRRKDFILGLNLQTSDPDPDPTLDLFFGYGSSLYWDGYCNPEVDQLIEKRWKKQTQIGEHRLFGISSASWARKLRGRLYSMLMERLAGTHMSRT